MARRGVAMTLSLRPYQRAAIDALYDYFGMSAGNPLVVMPTGTGKSLCIAGFIREEWDRYAPAIKAAGIVME